MSLNDAHAFALSLATTLMVAIVIFRAGDGSLSVSPAAEYDGDISEIVHEVDPFAP
jgi:FlaG/FlaF family flagellin (archaellin)